MHWQIPLHKAVKLFNKNVGSVFVLSVVKCVCLLRFSRGGLEEANRRIRKEALAGQVRMKENCSEIE